MVQPAEPAPKNSPDDEIQRSQTFVPVLQSSSLFQGTNEVHIQHGNETYRLRMTKAGKLILQK